LPILMRFPSNASSRCSRGHSGLVGSSRIDQTRLVESERGESGDDDHGGRWPRSLSFARTETIVRALACSRQASVVESRTNRRPSTRQAEEFARRRALSLSRSAIDGDRSRKLRARRPDSASPSCRRQR
jgi:hypothetical protein